MCGGRAGEPGGPVLPGSGGRARDWAPDPTPHRQSAAVPASAASSPRDRPSGAAAGARRVSEPRRDPRGSGTLAGLLRAMACKASLPGPRSRRRILAWHL